MNISIANHWLLLAKSKKVTLNYFLKHPSLDIGTNLKADGSISPFYVIKFLSYATLID